MADSFTQTGEPGEYVAAPAPRRGARLHPLFLDLGLTAGTSALTLITGLVLVSLFGKFLGAIALGEYLLLRRVYQWLQTVSLLGIHNGLPRYVAISEKDPPERDRYLLSALLFSALATIAIVAVLAAGPAFFGRWLFGRSDLGPLVIALALFLMGGSAHSIIYGYYRGRLQMKRANALQLLNLAAIPVLDLILLFHTRSAALIVDGMGIGMIFCSALFALPLLPRAWAAHSRGVWPPLLILLRYSAPRVPGVFALGALLALGPIVASHVLPLKEVTALLLGMSIMSGISASAEPLGLILLSKVSRIVSENRLDDFRTHLEYLEEAIIAAYAFICLQVIVFADVLVRAWVGPRLLDGMDVIRITLVSIPFYLFFAALRSIIDAKSVTPYNTFNVALAGTFFVVLLTAATFLSPRGFLLESIALATVLGFTALAWLTSRTMRKLFAIRLNVRRIAFAAGLSVALAIASLWLRTVIGTFLPGPTTVLEALAIEALVTAVFFGVLRRTRSPWLPFFWNLALQRRPAHA